MCARLACRCNVTHSDPIADMLTRIRNAQAVRHDWVTAPSSKLKVAILDILKREGYVGDYRVSREGVKETVRIRLTYGEADKPSITGLRRVSKPGLKVYVDKKELPRFYGGRGLSIISTSDGVMTGQDAWRRGIGGELLCYVW